MYPLIGRSLRLVLFIFIAAVSMLVWEKSFVFADSSLNSEAQQNDPEANLKYLFAVFFLAQRYLIFTLKCLERMLIKSKPTYPVAPATTILILFNDINCLYHF